jgi:hypothetical protein
MTVGHLWSQIRQFVEQYGKDRFTEVADEFLEKPSCKTCRYIQDCKIVSSAHFMEYVGGEIKPKPLTYCSLWINKSVK